MLRSLGAVLAGVFLIITLSILTDVVLESAGFFPPPDQGLYDTWLLVIALAYRTAYALLGGYVTAKLAPSNPMKHVKSLLIIGIIMGTLGVIGGWNLSQNWYPISLVIASAIAVWYGGQLAVKKTKK